MSMKRERGNHRNGGTNLSEEIAHPAPLNLLLLQVLDGQHSDVKLKIISGNSPWF